MNEIRVGPRSQLGAPETKQVAPWHSYSSWAPKFILSPLTVFISKSSQILKTVTQTEQVAQLWQRDRVKLDTFVINVQIAFWGHPVGASGAI